MQIIKIPIRKMSRFLVSFDCFIVYGYKILKFSQEINQQKMFYTFVCVWSIESVE